MTTNNPDQEIASKPDVNVTIEKPSIQEPILTLEAKIAATIMLVATEAKKVNPNVNLSHEELQGMVDLTKDFYKGSQEVGNYLFKESHKVSDDLSKIPGVVGTIGLGYPFYAINTEGKDPVHVPEISNFLETTRELVDEDMRYNPEGWKCPGCQLENKLPDLKTLCKPCDLVKLKPRDVFKALPDLDVIVIVDNPN